MNSAQLDALVAWIAAHPVAAGAAIFAIAFCDALLVIGAAVPLIPIFFAVGTLIGLGSIDPLYAIVCATLGAFLGDGVSYVLGRRYGDRLRRMWPFSRYPQWLTSGEAVFAKHGVMGLLIARYVGAIRPFVPAIAGMLGMRGGVYASASGVASATWAVVFLAPGWLFGASIELIGAIAGRLSIVLLALAASLALIYWLVVKLYGFFAPRAAGLIEAGLKWSHRHPLLGRISSPLVDPNEPESASLLLLGATLLAAAVGLGWLAFDVLGGGEPLSLDLAVQQFMLGLRSPFADHLMAGFSTLGDWQALGPPVLIALLWLLRRRRWLGAAHWVAAVTFGVIATQLIGHLLDAPPPPVMSGSGFGFPAAPVTHAALVYGFFAVLIAREMPGRRRAWPYVLAGFLLTLLAFSRLYFGAHWASDVLGGLLLAIAWTSLLGLAYRRHVRRSFWMRPLALWFYGSLLLATSLHAAWSSPQVLRSFQLPSADRDLPIASWRDGAWSSLESRRSDISLARAWPLNLQYAGNLSDLRERLQAAGWQPLPPPGWGALLRSFDPGSDAGSLPPLSATHGGRRESLVMLLPANGDERRWVLRLWRSDVLLQPGGQRLWIGNIGQMALREHWQLIRVWHFLDHGNEGIALLQPQLAGWPLQRRQRETGEAVLLLQPPPPVQR
jgi:membrane protein DedA with SNARE-associated domain/membrane-associated phospholipid phosphatase